MAIDTARSTRPIAHTAPVETSHPVRPAAKSPSARGVGVALQPISNVMDHSPTGYEAMPRPGAGADPLEVVSAALRASQHATPAVVLIPMPARLLDDPDFDPIAQARVLGIAASDIGWLVPAGVAGRITAARAQRLQSFRAAGFRLAIDRVRSPLRCQHVLAALRPDFVILDSRLVRRIGGDEVLQAHVAGLVSCATRLGARLVGRGIADEQVAMAMFKLAVQHGIGPHLGGPVIVEAALAAPQDTVISPAWFRARDVQMLPNRREAVDAPARFMAIPDIGVVDSSDHAFSRVLGEAARLVQGEHDVDSILRVVAELLPRVVPARSLAIFEADWETDRIVPRVLGGDEVRGMTDCPANAGITGWALARGVPYNCPDTAGHPAAGGIPGHHGESDAESMIAVPLVAGDHKLGVLDVWRDGLSAFTALELERCSLFGHLLAAAWRNTQLYVELESRTRTDALTGLFNTRWWNEMAPSEVARSVRSGSEIGILLLDIDHFKQINDLAGHAAGDVVLRNVARALGGAVRAGDAVIRRGGEEFLVMLHDCGEGGALRVAEVVRDGLARVPHPGSPGGVTASIGVAVFPRHGRDLEEVARAADAAMYRAKAEGRNRVTVAPLS